MTTPRTRRPQTAATASADASGLTPAQRTALHQVYRLILTFAQAEPATGELPPAQPDRQPAGVQP